MTSVKWKPHEKHLVSPSGVKGISCVSVCERVCVCVHVLVSGTSNVSYSMCCFDVSVWSPWLCLCLPLIKIIDEEAQTAHLRLCGSVIGFIFRLDGGFKTHSDYLFSKVYVWLRYPKSLPIENKLVFRVLVHSHPWNHLMEYDSLLCFYWSCPQVWRRCQRIFLGTPSSWTCRTTVSLSLKRMTSKALPTYM